MNLDDITLLTVSFNNNILTGMMLKSFRKQCGRLPNDVVIVDNGTTFPIDDTLRKIFTIVDNYQHQLLPDEHQPSRNHGAAIDFALKHVIHTKWCLLVDNDILYKPSLRSFLSKIDDTYDIYGEIGWDITPPDRLFPYFCLINTEKFNTEGRNYFVRNRYISYCMPNCHDITVHNHHDTGCSFYEDIYRTWSIYNINMDDYMVHLKGGMLKHKNIYKWFDEHRELIM